MLAGLLATRPTNAPFTPYKSRAYQEEDFNTGISWHVPKDASCDTNACRCLGLHRMATNSVKRLTRSVTVQSHNNLRYVTTTFQLNNRRAAISHNTMMHPLYKLQGIQNLFAHLSSDRNVRESAQELRLGRLAMGEGYHPTGKGLEARLYHSEKNPTRGKERKEI